MLATRKLVTVFSILAAEMIVAPVFALKVTEPAAASHGYPGFCDMNGKKLADGEFRQWVENNRLHVVITYKFSAGEVYEEHSQFRQESADSGKMVVERIETWEIAARVRGGLPFWNRQRAHQPRPKGRIQKH